MNIIKQREAVRKSYDRYTESLSRPIGLVGTDTGHHLFNIMTGGHVPTKITTFATRAGHGKTMSLVAMSKAAGRVQNDKRSELLIGSWEMESSYLIDRAVCHDTGLTIQQLRYPKLLTEEEKKAVLHAYTEASKLPVHYHQHSTDIYKLIPKLEEFVKKTEEKAKIEGISIQPVFALDFIGRIKGASKYSNKTNDIENFLQELKQYANDSGLAVYILAQLLRSADEREMPELMDIKDSSSIEENSDSLFIGWRPEYLGRETMQDPFDGSTLPSSKKMLIRAMKVREANPGDYIINCDAAHFRMWDRNFSFEFPYYTLYQDELWWESQLRS